MGLGEQVVDLAVVVEALARLAPLVVEELRHREVDAKGTSSL